MQLTPEEQLILLSVGITADVSTLERIDQLITEVNDWEIFLETIINRGIGPLFLQKISSLKNKHIIPENVITKLRNVYHKTLTRSMLLSDQFVKISKLFDEHRIRTIVLKGTLLSEWLYNDIGLRQFSDIDLLVPEEKARECISLLESMGYVASYIPVSKLIDQYSEVVHYPPMIKNGVSIEIHIRLHRTQKEYDFKIKEMIRDAVPVQIYGIKTLSLSLYDLIIHVCVHADKHFRAAHIQFTSINDIVNLMLKHGDVIDWDDFTERCCLHECETAVFSMLMLTYHFMNVPLPERIVSDYAGLFNQKDAERFVMMLRGHHFTAYQVPNHFGNIKKIKNPFLKMVYFIQVIFPPKKFMVYTYRIKRPALFFLYYPKRLFIGFKGLLKMFGV